MRQIRTGVAVAALAAANGTPLAGQASKGAAARETFRYRVGPNIQVSRAFSRKEHYEVILATHPTQPHRMLAGAMMEVPGGKPGRCRSVAYRSTNRGRTWSPTLVDPVAPDEFSMDPTAAFGPDGTAYFATMLEPQADRARHAVRLYRSTDARSWKRIDLKGVIDRPYLAADQTGGKYRGRLYCSSHFFGARDPRETPSVSLSNDHGRSLSAPRGVRLEPPLQAAGMGNPVVLSDGTLVFLHTAWDEDDPRGSRFRHLLSVRSPDGGGRFVRARNPVAQYTTASAPYSIPVLAVAPPGSPNVDRLFAVWCDSGATSAAVHLAYSDDRGETWRGHQVLSENASERAKRWFAFLPTVAVNRKGVVAVTWYDSRGLPSGQKGWNLRVRASTDGGGSWSASVPVSERTSRFGKVGWGPDDPAWPGHTAGLAADAKGAFHALWVDNRTGVRQVWTARIE